MGNVSSSEHDKVNGVLSRRAKKRVGSTVGRKKKQKRQQEQLHEYCLPHQPAPIPLKEPVSSTVLAYSSTTDTDLYSQGPLQAHRPTSFPGSSTTVSQPAQNDSFSNKRFSESQADFYSMTRADYSSWPPTSPTMTFSTTPSTVVPSPTSQTYNSSAVHNLSSTQELLPPYRSAPIAIPQQLPKQGKHAGTNGLDTLSINPSISPKRRDSDNHSHYYQQQRELSVDLHLLGTSPEAKEWLKQKPTRSTTRMIHQYNFQNYQHHQPSRNLTITVNNSRTLSNHSNSPISPGTNPNSNITRGPVGFPDVPMPQLASKQGTGPVTAATTVIASNDGSTTQLGTFRDPPSLPARSAQRHFDGHFYGQNRDISPPLSQHNLAEQSWNNEPQIGHLIMSRSKITSHPISVMPSASSTSLANLSGDQKN
ncbi:hypothetical protein BGX27_003337 [Mortierella sp. AM989]|nr:hypothetical protein BGX27_003337 [Mortierella sp. AM989]